MTRRRRTRRYRTLTAAVLTATALSCLTGCAQSVDPIERLGKKAAQKVRRHSRTTEQAYHRWGLPTPLAPPPKPAAQSPARHSDAESSTHSSPVPPVLDHVRTRDRVIFLTYDDAAGKDVRFLEMIGELRLPATMFSGTRSLRGLPYADQRAAICGRRGLLRPAYGAYDRTTLRAAADCGVSAVILWRAATTADGIAYVHGAEHLRPGDIVLITPDAAPTPNLPERTARLLRGAQSRGLTVGRLEDYL